jgi:protein prenyltransferase alpha subunit repeat containing protein 1
MMSQQSSFNTGTDVISQLADLLRQEPLPKELEITILPFPEDDETDASSFLKDGIHLGIHAPHVPLIASKIRNAYNKFRCTVLLQDEEGECDTSYNIISKYMDCISCLLLLCPDHATAWADRRRLLQKRQRTKQYISPKDLLSLWDDEIRYMNLLFTQHSKAPNAWGHRKWVSRQVLLMFQSSLFTDHRTTGVSGSMLQWCTPELAVCSVIAEKYPKNYYAWTYRGFLMRALVQEINGKNDNADDREELCSFLQSEMDFILSWLFHHVSDHSAAHYGGEVAVSLLLHETSEDRKTETRNKMLLSSCQLLEKFPSHEVIWIWRRICFRVMFDFYITEKSSKEEAIECIDSLFKDEIVFVQSFIEKSERWIDVGNRDLQSQKYFAIVYSLWIHRYALRHFKKLDVDHALFQKQWTLMVRKQIDQYKQVCSCDHDGPSVPELWLEMFFDDDD